MPHIISFKLLCARLFSFSMFPLQRRVHVCHIIVYFTCAIFPLYWMCVQVIVVITLAHNQDVRCKLFCQFQVQIMKCVLQSVCMNSDAQCGNASQTVVFFRNFPDKLSTIYEFVWVDVLIAHFLSCSMYMFRRANSPHMVLDNFY